MLTGVNIGQYSSRGATLVDLLREIEAIPDVTRLRISSIEPTTVPAALLELMAASTKLCRYLHLPLQSGDDGILQAMNRRYSVREYEELVEQALKLMPDLGLGTDLMVGFPSEGEQAFANTVRIAERLPFSYLHVFSYSSRPGTAAARLENQIPLPVIRQRSKILAGLSRTKTIGFYQAQIGHTVQVLFEQGERDGFRSGTTTNFTRVAVPTDAVVAGSIHMSLSRESWTGWHMVIQSLPSWNQRASPYYDHETARETPSGPYRNFRLPDERVRLGARPVFAPQSRVRVY